MHRRKTLIRALVAVLAAAAIAAPTAFARPLDPNTQQPHNPQAEDEAKPPVYWSYEYEVPTPRAQDRSVSGGGDDTPWVIIGLGITGASLLAGGGAMASRTRMRARRARIAA